MCWLDLDEDSEDESLEPVKPQVLKPNAGPRK